MNSDRNLRKNNSRNNKILNDLRAWPDCISQKLFCNPDDSYEASLDNHKQLNKIPRIIRL